jgi:FkbM family methyltransferase
VVQRANGAMAHWREAVAFCGMLREHALQIAGNLSRRLPPSRFKNRVGRAIAYAVGDPPAVRADIGLVRYYLRPAGRTESGMFWSGEDENHVIDLLAALTPTTGTFVDIGANVGLVGLRVAALVRPKRTILVEPIGANVRLLTESIRLTGLADGCVVLPFGLSDNARAAALYVEADVRRTGNAGPVPRRGTTKVPITLRTLDESVEGKIDVIKIDVEGEEPAVLAGGGRAIAASLPVIYGEFADVTPGRPSNIVAVMDTLGPLGYRIFAFLSDRHLVEVRPVAGRGNALLVPPGFVPPVGWKFDFLD